MFECKVPTFPGVGVVIHDPLTPMDPDMTPMTGAQAVALMTGKGSKATDLERELQALGNDLKKLDERIVSVIGLMHQSLNARGTEESTPRPKR